jgi:hypothetical protein
MSSIPLTARWRVISAKSTPVLIQSQTSFRIVSKFKCFVRKLLDLTLVRSQSRFNLAPQWMRFDFLEAFYNLMGNCGYSRDKIRGEPGTSGSMEFVLLRSDLSSSVGKETRNEKRTRSELSFPSDTLCNRLAVGESASIRQCQQHAIASL